MSAGPLLICHKTAVAVERQRKSVRERGAEKWVIDHSKSFISVLVSLSVQFSPQDFSLDINYIEVVGPFTSCGLSLTFRLSNALNFLNNLHADEWERPTKQMGVICLLLVLKKENTVSYVRTIREMESQCSPLYLFHFIKTSLFPR